MPYGNPSGTLEEDENERRFRELIAQFAQSNAPAAVERQQPAEDPQELDVLLEARAAIDKYAGAEDADDAAMLSEIERRRDEPTRAALTMEPAAPPTPDGTDMDISMSEIERYEREHAGSLPTQEPSGSAWSAATERSSREVTPIKPAENYHDTAGRVADSGPGTGERPNEFGYEDEKLTYDRQRLMNEAAEAYDRVSGGAQEDPDWTLEFTSGHKRMSDKDIHRAYQLQSLMWGPQHGMRYREMLQKEQDSYETGLAKARERDLAERGGGRISKGLAQAMVAARAVTPEVAATLQKGDELVRAFTNGGGLAQAARQEQMEQRYHLNNINNNQKMAALREQMARFESERQTRVQMGADANASRERAAANRPRPGAATAGQPKPEKLTPEEKDNLLNVLTAKRMSGVSEGAKFTKEQGARIRAGDLSELTPEQARDAEFINAELAALAKTPTGLNQILVDAGKLETSAESRTEVRVNDAVQKSIAMQINNPDKRNDWQTKWHDSAAMFSEADAAWREMTPEGRNAFVKWNANGLAGDVSKAIMGSEDQARATVLRTLANELIKARSGSAVTGSEWDRIAAELGMSAGAWSPFAEPSGITLHLDRVFKALTRHRQSYEATHKGWYTGEVVR